MDERLRLIQISLDHSIRDALPVIEEGACEIALAVDADGRLLGTLSDGDIRRALMAGAGLDDSIESFVTTEPFVVTVDASRNDVLDLMRAQSLTEIPVVDADRRLVGIHLLKEMIGVADRPNWALILAGGRGTRLAPLTESIPKPMVKVAGRPILERLVLHLVGYGIREIVLSVNYLAEIIESHFGDGSRFGCRIRYVEDTVPLGTAGPLRLARDLADDLEHPILVLNGDLVTEFSVDDLLRSHEASGAVATVAARPYSHTVPFGVIEADETRRVTQLREKPIVEWSINAGIYVVNPALIEHIPADVEYPITALLEDSVRRGEHVGVWSLDDDWHDVGRFSDLRAARGEV